MSEHPKVWFITGTSTGLGHAMALAALEHGDRVVATAREPHTLDKLITRFPETALALKLDVRDEAACDQAVEAAVARFGRIDVVVNNAAYSLFGPVETTTDEQIKTCFETNVFGVLNVLRATLPVLRAQRSGHVVQVSSILGHTAFPGSGVMSAAKQSVGALTEALRIELSPFGIHCTLIEPAGLDTRFMTDMNRSESTVDYAAIVDPVLEHLIQAPLVEQQTEVARVADVVLGLVDTDQPPLHLVLGRGCEDAVRGALTGRLTELDSWLETTRKVDVVPVS